MFRQGEQKSYLPVHSAIVGGGWRELKEHFPAVFGQNTITGCIRRVCRFSRGVIGIGRSVEGRYTNLQGVCKEGIRIFN